MSQNRSNLSVQDLTAQLASYLTDSALEPSPPGSDTLEQRIFSLQLLGETLAASVVQDLPLAEQVDLLQGMDAAELMAVLNAMAPERCQQLMASLPPETQDQLIANLSAEFQTTLRWLFSAPKPPAAIDLDPSNPSYPDWWEIDDCGD